MSTITYRSGYKYQLLENYSLKTGITPEGDIVSDFVTLRRNGELLVRKGYAWDGPSGPAVDTKNFMRGLLVHDALYQLMRDNGLPTQWRDEADTELRRCCFEDGMSWLRAWWVHRAVRLAATKEASPESQKKVYTAP